MDDRVDAFDKFLAGFEVSDDGAYVLEAAFRDEIPSCVDERYFDVADTMQNLQGSMADVTWTFAHGRMDGLPTAYFDPVHGLMATCRHQPDHRLGVFRFDVEDLRAWHERHPRTSLEGYVARLAEGHVPIARHKSVESCGNASNAAFEALAGRIAADGRWVLPKSDLHNNVGRLIRDCDETVRRCERIKQGVHDWQVNKEKAQRRAMVLAGGREGTLAAMGAYLANAAEEFDVSGGWHNLTPNEAVRSFVTAVERGGFNSPLPRELDADVACYETMAGTLRAVVENGGINIDLDKPDGTSGMVAFVECDTDGVNTFAWNGNDADAQRTVADPFGREMTYEPRDKVERTPAEVAREAHRAETAMVAARNAVKMANGEPYEFAVAAKFAAARSAGTLHGGTTHAKAK